MPLLFFEALFLRRRLQYPIAEPRQSLPMDSFCLRGCCSLKHATHSAVAIALPETPCSTVGPGVFSKFTEWTSGLSHVRSMRRRALCRQSQKSAEATLQLSRRESGQTRPTDLPVIASRDTD